MTIGDRGWPRTGAGGALDLVIDELVGRAPPALLRVAVAAPIAALLPSAAVSALLLPGIPTLLLPGIPTLLLPIVAALLLPTVVESALWALPRPGRDLRSQQEAFIIESLKANGWNVACTLDDAPMSAAAVLMHGRDQMGQDLLQRRARRRPVGAWPAAPAASPEASPSPWNLCCCRPCRRRRRPGRPL